MSKTTTNPLEIGFIGLGDMGAAMASNIARAGTPLKTFDQAGTAERAPEGSTVAVDAQEIARSVDVIFVCVPDGAASLAVARDLASANDRQVKTVVNLSTTGIQAVKPVIDTLAAASIDYVDAPVSGGRAGAIGGTITVMWSGSREMHDQLQPVLEAFSGSVVFVGPEPGQGQALKLLNNFLSGIALTATSEAIAFGLNKGLEMNTMLDALNVSTGRNTATSDKFPNRIATGTYDAGFRMALMQKDVSLYLNEVQIAGSPDLLGKVVANYFSDGMAKFPDGDFTEIFKVIKDGNT